MTTSTAAPRHRRPPVDDRTRGRPRATAAKKGLTSRMGLGRRAGHRAAVDACPPSACSSPRSGRRSDIKTNGWWNFFTDPPFTLDNYHEVLSAAAPRRAWRPTSSTRSSSRSRRCCSRRLAALAAYAFAWIDFQGRDWLFVAIFALQIVPLQMALVPLLQLFVRPAGRT